MECYLVSFKKKAVDLGMDNNLFSPAGRQSICLFKVTAPRCLTILVGEKSTYQEKSDQKHSNYILQP
jgi:hypothetical protein